MGAHSDNSIYGSGVADSVQPLPGHDDRAAQADDFKTGIVSGYWYSCNGDKRGCERERFGMCDYHDRQAEQAVQPGAQTIGENDGKETKVADCSSASASTENPEGSDAHRSVGRGGEGTDVLLRDDHPQRAEAKPAAEKVEPAATAEAVGRHLPCACDSNCAGLDKLPGDQYCIAAARVGWTQAAPAQPAGSERYEAALFSKGEWGIVDRAAASEILATGWSEKKIKQIVSTLNAHDQQGAEIERLNHDTIKLWENNCELAAKVKASNRAVANGLRHGGDAVAALRELSLALAAKLKGDGK
jgi:hypothetical protein